MLRRARSVKGSHIDIALAVSSYQALTPPGFRAVSRRSRRSPAYAGPNSNQRFDLRAAEPRRHANRRTGPRSTRRCEGPRAELGILELGLVYDITTEGENGENVNVMMTLTSPMCPVGPMFMQSVKDHVLAVEGVKNANVEITFMPPWDPRTMASDDVKAMLGIW